MSHAGDNDVLLEITEDTESGSHALEVTGCSKPRINPHCSAVSFEVCRPLLGDRLSRRSRSVCSVVHGRV